MTATLRPPDALDLANAAPCRVIGVEHEFVVGRAGRQVHFGTQFARLGLDRDPIHPTNPALRYLRTGAAIMADGPVAEIATPPVAAAPGATVEISARAAQAAATLRGLLPDDLAVEGYSTHISVEVSSPRADLLSKIYARSCAAALMLLTERSTSPGMLVRPRPGRNELCCEYVTGESLRVAIAFATATTVALETALEAGRGLPPMLDVELEMGRRRFGWYVDRAAFGNDLYRSGRRTVLRRLDGSRCRAGEHLVDVWEFARDAAVELFSPAEYELVDRAVAGNVPSPLEVPLGSVASDDDGDDADLVVPEDHVFGRALAVDASGSVAMRVVAATWDWIAYEATAGGERAIAVVPRRQLEGFIDSARSGALGHDVEQFLAGRRPGRTFRSHAQADAARLYDGIRTSSASMPEDRVGVGPGTPARERPGKLVVGPPHHDPPGEPSEDPSEEAGWSTPSGPRRSLLIGTAVGLVGAVAFGAWWSGRDDGVTVADPPPAIAASASTSIAPTTSAPPSASTSTTSTSTTSTSTTSTSTTSTTVAASDDVLPGTVIDVPSVDLADRFFVPTRATSFRDDLGNVYLALGFDQPLTEQTLVDFDTYSRAIQIVAGPVGNPNTGVLVMQHDGEFSVQMSHDKARLWITGRGDLMWFLGLASTDAYDGLAKVTLFAQQTTDGEFFEVPFEMSFGGPDLAVEGPLELDAAFPDRVELRPAPSG